MNCQSLLEKFDWKSTPLGDLSVWPDSLRACVSICMLQPQASCILWGEEQIQIYNNAYAKSIGDKHPAVFGASARKTWSNDWEVRGKMAHSILFDGEPFHSENYKTTIAVGGVKQVRHFTFTASGIQTNAGIHGIFITSVDTTDIVLQEMHLRKMRMDHLKDLFLQAPVPLTILMGPELIVEVANDAMLALWGRTARKMIGKPVFESIPEARMQGFEELLMKVLTTGERIAIDQIPLTLNRKSKEDKMLIRIIYTPLREASGVISGVMILAEEVTDQIRARKRLEENEERLKMAVLSTGMGTWEYDVISNKFASSEECRIICGIPESEKSNYRIFRDVMLPEEQRKFDYAAAKARADGTGKFSIVHRIKRYDDGAVQWIQSWGTIIFNRLDQPEKFIGTIINITPQRIRGEGLAVSQS